MKKIISVLLSVVMLATITAGIDFSAYAATNKAYTLGTTEYGQITQYNEKNVYTLSVPSSGKIIIAYSSNIAEQKVELFNGDASNSVCTCNTNWNNTTEVCTANEVHWLNQGTYILIIERNYMRADSYGDYNFTISFESSNETVQESYGGNNNSLVNASPINLGQSYIGQICYDDEKDIYKFNVSSGYYTITYNGYFASQYVELYDHTGTNSVWGKLYGWNSSTEIAAIKENVYLNEGVYYFVVRKNTWSAAVGKYNFIISPVTSTPAPAQTTAVKKPGKVTIGKVTTAKKGKIKTTWKKKSGVSGYQIYYSRSKSFKKLAAKKTVSGGKKTSYTGKNFTKGKKYYVKVRAYKTVNGKKYYGSWSKVKSVKCK